MLDAEFLVEDSRCIPLDGQIPPNGVGTLIVLQSDCEEEENDFLLPGEDIKRTVLEEDIYLPWEDI